MALADGVSVPTKQGLRVKIKLQNMEVEGVALVMTLPAVYLIVGNNLLRQFGKLTVEYSPKKSDSTAAIVSLNEGELSVALPEDVIIPAQSVLAIPMRFQTENADQTYVMEPSTMLFQQKGVSMGHSILSQGEPAWLSNLTNKRQVLFKGTKVARLETFGEEITPPRLNAILPTKTDPSRTIDSVKEGKINQQINPNITTEKQESLKLLLAQHQECFAENSKDLGSCEVLTHRIDTGEAKPIHQQPYPSSQKQREILQKHVAEMLNDGVIEPSCSP